MNIMVTVNSDYLLSMLPDHIKNVDLNSGTVDLTFFNVSSVDISEGVATIVHGLFTTEIPTGKIITFRQA